MDVGSPCDVTNDHTSSFANQYEQTQRGGFYVASNKATLFILFSVFFNMAEGSYLELCTLVYPHVDAFPTEGQLLKMWADERNRKRKHKLDCEELSLEDMPLKTMERLIKSNVFAIGCGLHVVGRPSKRMFIAKAKQEKDVNLVLTVMERALNIKEIFEDPGCQPYVGIFERDVRKVRASVLVVAGLFTHSSFVELRGFAAVRRGQGHGSAFLARLQELNREIFLYSSSDTAGFYTARGFRRCKCSKHLSVVVKFVNATAYCWTHV